MSTIVLAAPPLWAWNGKVNRILSCDQLLVQHHQRLERVRLYGIACRNVPGPGPQPAKQFTSQRTMGKVVKVNPISKDDHGWTLSLVYVQGHLLNESLIREGHAVVDPGSCGLAMCREWLGYQQRAR